MTGWTTQAVLAAAAAWTWTPAGSTTVAPGDYELTMFPGHLRASFPVEVQWSRSERPVAELVGEIAGHVRSFGHGEVYWMVSDATRPAGTEAELARRGAALVETCQVMAWDLTGGVPELGPSPGVRTEVVDGEAALRAADVVNTEVWGDGQPLREAAFAITLAEVRRGLAGWSGFRVVGYLDGEPASYGGCTLVDGVARLWGAGTRAKLRGRGAYRAVLARRLALAREHGATLALVKGRVETSAPILSRAGFTVYGEQRCYRLDVSGGTT
ncbi:MAG TPA: hypothetical protein VGH27_32750 [Streptosporangiaceae bacterium]|jgi:hypothetical protein